MTTETEAEKNATIRGATLTDVLRTATYFRERVAAGAKPITLCAFVDALRFAVAVREQVMLAPPAGDDRLDIGVNPGATLDSATVLLRMMTRCGDPDCTHCRQHSTAAALVSAHMGLNPGCFCGYCVAVRQALAIPGTLWSDFFDSTKTYHPQVKK